MRRLGAIVLSGVFFGACRTAPSIDEGRRLYRANGCANCHGPSGAGDGPVGKTLTPPPRDLRDASTYKNGANAASVARTLGGMQNSQMPRFDHLTTDERQAIAMFVVSLQGKGADRDR